MTQRETPDGEGFPTGEDPDLVTMGVPRPPRRRPGRVASLTGVAALAAVGGVGVGLAITHSGTANAADTAAMAGSSPAASPSPPAKGPGGHHRWVGGELPFRAGLGLGPGGMLHGQFTAPKSGGGYRTIDVQRGKVSAVSPSSVTVKSADGFTATYAVTSATVVHAETAGIGSVKQGDTIFVTATVSGAKATAANVVDMTAIRDGRASFGFPRMPHGPRDRPAAPATP